MGEGSCEHGNEPSGSIKCWEILRVAPQLAASQEGLSCMELIGKIILKLYINGLFNHAVECYYDE
jgi:hypothetical protein